MSSFQYQFQSIDMYKNRTQRLLFWGHQCLNLKLKMQTVIGSLFVDLIVLMKACVT